MPKITALIHTRGAQDAPHLERALASLEGCDEVLIINHVREPRIERIARDHGAHVKAGVPGVSPGTYLVDARNDWILCLLARESLSESLQAALLAWKETQPGNRAFSVPLKEQSGNSWQSRAPETRLVNRTQVNWTGDLPPDDPQASLLPGELLRFSQ